MIQKRHSRFCSPVIFSALVLFATSALAAGSPESPGRQGMQGMQGSSGFSGEAVQTNQIIGKNVKNNKGETVGEIKNLVIDPQSGRILLATVSVGGFLGIADSTYPVPWKSFQVKKGAEEGTTGTPSARQQPPAGGYGGGPASPGAERGGAMQSERRGGLFGSAQSVTLVLDIDKEKLKNAPRLDNEDQLSDRSYLQQVFSHYGIQQLEGMGSGR